jgi:hypothetical protein
MRFPSLKFLHQIVARVRRWTTRRSAEPVLPAELLSFSSYSAGIHRDVTPNSVRFYSLCGCCGARLHASATLCEECAQRKRPARPF